MILSKAGGRDSKGLGANYLSSWAPPGVPTMDSLIITSLSIEVEEKTFTLVQGHLTLTLSFTFYLGYQPSALPLPQAPSFIPLFPHSQAPVFPSFYPLSPWYSPCLLLPTPVPCPLGSPPSFLSTSCLPSSSTPHHPLGCPWVLR